MPKMHYGIYGDGPPLVLLTGITGSIDHYWKTLLPSLTKNYTTILIDNRGSGKSDIPDEPYTIEMMARDTIGVIRELKLEKPSILGHSMGGAIALTLGHLFGGEIDKLIVVNAFPKLNQRGVLLYQAIDQLLKEGYSQEKVFWIAVPWLFSEEYLEDPKQRENIQKYFASRNLSIVGFQHQLGALVKFDARTWLTDIPSETLIIASQDDILTPRGQAEELRDKILSSHLAILPGGHCSHLEQPSALLHLVKDFL